MNFSDQWRSLWSVSSVFAPPNLVSFPQSSSLGPLLFHPTGSPVELLAAAIPRAYKLTPPLSAASNRDALRAFFRSPFLSFDAVDSLAADLFPSSATAPQPIQFNILAALRRRRYRSSLLLFFPHGENSHGVGYISVFLGPSLMPRVSNVFTYQRNKRCHRIMKLVVSGCSDCEEFSDGDSVVVEGYLIAATMFSVKWFRIESVIRDDGERPVLVLDATQKFENCVVDACWSPYFPKESVVLLENGVLFLYNVDDETCTTCFSEKQFRTVQVRLNGEEVGGWFSCDYGGQPWILILACASAVVLVDLRAENMEDLKVLARIDIPNMYGVVRLIQGNNFLAFCKSLYDDFHYAVVTENQLLLFDIRQPLFPILQWDHGLDYPCYVAMYRLSELRRSEEFKSISEKGFVILVGSFGNDKFNLFCCGPKDGRVTDDFSLYAWELPSSLSLSGPNNDFFDVIMEETLKERTSVYNNWKPRKDLVVGFYVVPHELLNTEPETSATRDFALIRLMLSGKLEMQTYQTSRTAVSETNICVRNGSELNDIIVSCADHEEKISTRYSYLRFGYLYEYLGNNLSNALDPHACKVINGVTNANYFDKELTEAIENLVRSSTLPTSAFINDVGLPTCVFEIAARRVLTDLDPALLHLAFAKYSQLVGSSCRSFIEFLELPSSPDNRVPPFFLGRPSKRSRKWSEETLHSDTIVGPVLPLPFLNTLQERSRQQKSSLFMEDGQGDVLLSHQCKIIHESIYPEISIADIGHCDKSVASMDVEADRPFFVYEPTFLGGALEHVKTCSNSSDLIGEASIGRNPNLLSDPEVAYKDENYSTFICGIAENTNLSNTKDSKLHFDMFNLSPVSLDLDLPAISFSPEEEKIYKDLKLSFSRWQFNFEPYQKFCRLHNISKPS